jgi:hypothetical protein
MYLLTHKRTTSQTSTLSRWLLGFILLALLLTACSTGQGPSITSPSGTSGVSRQVMEVSPSPVVTVAVPTPQTSPGPSPVKTLLAPAPQHCPTAPSPGSTNVPHWGMVIGKSPVWELGLPPNGTLNLDQFGEASWPLMKIMWPVTSSFPSYVIVRVTNLQTGVQAWWDIGSGTPPPNQPVRPLIMNQYPNRVSSQKGWGTLLYLSQAGCYAMQVSWPGGQWRLLFAAGR